MIVFRCVQGAKDYLLGRNNWNDVDLNRDFPDLDRRIYEGEPQNNHLMRVDNFFLQMGILRI